MKRCEGAYQGDLDEINLRGRASPLRAPVRLNRRLRWVYGIQTGEYILLQKPNISPLSRAEASSKQGESTALWFCSSTYCGYAQDAAKMHLHVSACLACTKAIMAWRQP